MRPSTPAVAPSAYSPLQLLLNAYDQAIAACRARNTARAYRTIAMLREAHPCDSPSSAGIDGLYAFCERAVLSGDFFGATRTLEQLRVAWEAADHITKVPTVAVAADVRVFAPKEVPARAHRASDDSHASPAL